MSSTTILNEQLLDEKLVAMEKARSWAPRVISKLESFIRISDDVDLFRVNPIKFGLSRGLSETDAVDLFLYATRYGLFEMEWQLICPTCGHIIDSLADFGHLHTHVICQGCGFDTELSLDDFIQVSFTIALPIRSNSFRQPKTLSAENYFYHYSMTQDALFRPGLNLVDVMKQATRFIGTVHAGECITLNTDVHPIGVQFLDPQRVTVFMPCVEEQTTTDQLLKIDMHDDHFEFVNPPTNGTLLSGKATIQLENKSANAAMLWVRVAPPDAGKHFIEFEPFLSGKRLLTTQTFRDLFRTDPVEMSEGIGVKDITFLFTDLKGSTALYDQVGDTKAYFLVRQHFDTLARVIAQNHGAIVKTIGDAVMATFMTPNEAVKAAIEMIRDIDTFNKGITQDLILKIGVHRGHSIVVALNDRLDYFGQTVNIAARVQGLADANEIFVSEAAFGDPALTEIIAGC